MYLGAGQVHVPWRCPHVRTRPYRLQTAYFSRLAQAGVPAEASLFNGDCGGVGGLSVNRNGQRVDPCRQGGGHYDIHLHQADEVGVSPANETVAGAEPMVAVTGAVADMRLRLAGTPFLCAGLTGPDPVRYATIVLPLAAGLEGVLSELSADAD